VTVCIGSVFKEGLVFHSDTKYSNNESRIEKRKGKFFEIIKEEQFVVVLTFAGKEDWIDFILDLFRLEFSKLDGIHVKQREIYKTLEQCKTKHSNEIFKKNMNGESITFDEELLIGVRLNHSSFLYKYTKNGITQENWAVIGSGATSCAILLDQLGDFNYNIPPLKEMPAELVAMIMYGAMKFAFKHDKFSGISINSHLVTDGKWESYPREKFFSKKQFSNPKEAFEYIRKKLNEFRDIYYKNKS
jgi:20S proteasome alpha/beta subunit